MNERTRAYLDEVLPLDPTWQGPQLVAARERFLQQARGSETRASRSTEQLPRQLQEERIGAIAAAFFDREAAAIDQDLGALRGIDQPDLRRWVLRLQQAAALHDELAAFVADPAVDGKLQRAFAELFVMRPQDAVQQRAQQLRRTSPARGKALARLLEKRYPELAAAEAEQVAALRKIASARRLAKTPAAAFGTMIGIYVLIKVIAAIVRNSG